jgi:8-oxo-dGTP pyrophosphatase MutT (NUDIX family)
MTSLLQSLEYLFTAYRSSLHANQSGRHAAVLVPLVETPNGFQLLLTKRTDTVEHHKGQISFPGGVADDGDSSLTGTALREAFEEIGLPPESVRILGILDEVHTPSGFLITPVIGVVSALPVLQPNPAEVCEIISVPFELFFDEGNMYTELRSIEGKERLIYFYTVGAEPVWGATAFIIHRLVSLLREHGPGMVLLYSLLLFTHDFCNF